MSSLGIDGLASNLDTTSIINKLMQVEAGPQTLLKSKQTTTNKLITALQAMNSKVTSLGTAAASAAKSESWGVVKSSSSASSVAVTTSASAQAASLTFRTDAVAQSQVSLVTLPTSYPDGSAQLTISSGGKDTVVTAGTSSVADMVAAINKSGAPVRATAVNVGTADAPDYKLQLTGTTSGDAAAFTVSAVQTAGGTATPLSLTSVRAAQSAKLTLWQGTPAEKQVTSTTNTFTGLLTGTDVTISAVESSPVTVTITPDTDAKRTLASSIVSNLNLVLGEIKSQSAATESTDSSGRTVKSPGVLGGQSTVRGLQQTLEAAASYPIEGMSMASLGVSLQKDGTFAFDSAAYDKAMADDPVKTQAAFQAFAKKISDVTDDATDSVNGTLTTEIASQQGIVTDLSDRILDWDDRLTTRRAALQLQFTNMETAMSNAQAQSSWLTAQIASLTSSN